MGHPFFLHITKRSEWENASDDYRASSLDSEGFIHGSTPEQTISTANRYFRGQKDLVLLKIDESRLKSPVRWETSTGDEKFPHIYGPLQKDAVVDVVPLQEFGESGFALPVRAGVSLFSKIIRGEIPSYKVHEDEWTYSLLTRDAIQLGHSLVVPKLEVDHFSDVPEPYYSAIFKNARILSKAIQKVTRCGRVGAILAGWEVPHCHLHLIPTTGLSDFDFGKGKVRTHEENLAMQGEIIRALSL